MLAGVLGALALPVPKILKPKPITMLKVWAEVDVELAALVRFVPTGEPFRTKDGVMCVPGEFKAVKDV